MKGQYAQWLGTGESAFPSAVWADTSVRKGCIFQVLENEHPGIDGRNYLTLYHPIQGDFEMAAEHFKKLV